jgi:DNA-binding transcriptional ArsR family regulator
MNFMSTQSGHPHNGHSANINEVVSRSENARKAGNSVSVPVDWEHLARATAHPLRVSILEILGIDGGRVLSPNDLSHELQIPLSNTNYHVTELAKAGLIELVRERQVRGATEHFYRLPVSDGAKGEGAVSEDEEEDERGASSLREIRHPVAA